MTMSKRSMAELRKLRKKVEVYEETINKIAEGACMKSNPVIERSIKDCDARIREIDEKEEFLQKLELPSHDPGADEILRKIRERNKSIQNRGLKKKSKFDAFKRFIGGDDIDQ